MHLINCMHLLQQSVTLYGDQFFIRRTQRGKHTPSYVLKLQQVVTIGATFHLKVVSPEFKNTLVRFKITNRHFINFTRK